jgi:hypothetical protein
LPPVLMTANIVFSRVPPGSVRVGTRAAGFLAVDQKRGFRRGLRLGF